MSTKKLAFSLLLIAIGLASWGDTVFDPDEWSQRTCPSTEQDGQLRAACCDGTPFPP